MNGLERGLEAALARGEELLLRAPVAGGTIALRTPEGQCAAAFGTAGPGGPPMPLDARLEIGSISKSVAGLAAARLAVEGRIDLDAPVRALLPWLELPIGAGEPSLRHLLAHTAGWIAGSDALPGDRAQALALGETVAGSRPGAFFHYSNIGYVVLGLALEAACGLPYPEIAQRLVLEPLGIDGAVTNLTGARRGGLCRGTVPLRDDAPWSPADGIAEAPWLEPAGADGNVVATADELLRFARALTDPGSFAASAPWLPEAVAVAAAPSAPSGEGVLDVGPHLPAPGDRYGFGINAEPTARGTVLTHGGGMVGYGAFLIAHPEAGVSIAVLLSGPGERPYAELLARECHAAALGAGAAPGGADPIGALHAPRAPLDLDPVSAGGVAGTYRSYSPWVPHLEVGRDAGGRLMLRAYAGVEAPTEDVPLVALPGEGARTFRVGPDPRLPERIRFEGVIDGVAQVLVRDGGRFARVADR